MEQTIQPGEQMWLNLAQLIRNRVPDRKGNTLPLDVSTVTYDLQDRTAGSHSLTANALAVDSSRGLRVQHNYPGCCGDTSLEWGVDAFNLAVNDISLDPIYATDSCNGSTVNVSGLFDDWWSGNTSVATVTNTAVTGVSAGTTTANASGVIFLDGCFEDPVQVSAPVVVQVPTYFGPTGYTTTSCDCEANSAGTCINISDRVLDQNGSPMQISGVTPEELVCTSAAGCQTSYHTFSTPVSTPAAGTFNDTPIGTCFPNPTTNACVTVSVIYQAYIFGPTNSYPITTVANRTDCVQGEQDQISGNPSGYNVTYKTGTVP